MPLRRPGEGPSKGTKSRAETSSPRKLPSPEREHSPSLPKRVPRASSSSPRRSASPSKRKATSLKWRVWHQFKHLLVQHPVPTKAGVAAVTACLTHVILQIGVEGADSMDLLRVRNFTAGTLAVVIASHFWHQLLFTHIAKRSWFSAVCRLLPDQFFFAPLMTFLFLTIMLVTNGQNRFPHGHELFRAQVSFWKVWIMSQFILFLTLRAPDKMFFANLTGLAWTLTLSQVEGLAPMAQGVIDISPQGSSQKDLVLQHIPFNFGHTIATVMWGGSGFSKWFYALHSVAYYALPLKAKWWIINGSRSGEFSRIWGNLNPDLQTESEVTGCLLAFTPGKFWPKEVAEKYFADNQIFGMLRDPYERLIAQFRGNLPNYGGHSPEFSRTCDVNGALEKMLELYQVNPYANQCTLLPQAEYFDQPFGVAIAVDNRKFPDSANELLRLHGYSQQIAQQDIQHVSGCPEVWAGDLRCDVKAKVQEVYKRDFELLCQKFGYCNWDESVCIEGVKEMCPSNLEQRRENATHCQ